MEMPQNCPGGAGEGYSLERLLECTALPSNATVAIFFNVFCFNDVPLMNLVPGLCVLWSSWRSRSMAATGPIQQPPHRELTWLRSWKNTPRCLLTMQALMSRCLESVCLFQRPPAALKHHPKPLKVRHLPPWPIPTLEHWKTGHTQTSLGRHIFVPNILSITEFKTCKTCKTVLQINYVTLRLNTVNIQCWLSQ